MWTSISFEYFWPAAAASSVYAMMEIKPLSALFIALDPYFDRNNYFGTDAWCAAQGEGCMRYAILNKGQVVGTFCLYQYTRLGKQFVINPPMSPHCGLRLRVKGEKVYSRQSEIKRMVAAMANFLKQEFKGAFIDIALPYELSDVQPFQWKGFYSSPKYGYLLNLNRSEEELLRDMSTERRKNIKDGLSGGYELRLDPGAGEVVDMVTHTLKRAGASPHAELLRALIDSTHEETFAAMVSKDGVPLATAVCAHDERHAYYLAGGHNSGANDARAGSLALWHIICEAQHMGCVTFDFMGSSVPAIEKYFRGFGAKLEHGFRIHNDPGLIGWLQKQKRKYKKNK